MTSSMVIASLPKENVCNSFDTWLIKLTAACSQVDLVDVKACSHVIVDCVFIEHQKLDHSNETAFKE